MSLRRESISNSSDVPFSTQTPFAGRIPRRRRRNFLVISDSFYKEIKQNRDGRDSSSMEAGTDMARQRDAESH